MKKNNGVTLIVLAVTIVILTILSGVAINQALGDGGLINKTKDEKNTSRIKLINEAIQSYNLENKLGPTAEDIAEVLLRKNLINEDEKAEIDQTDRLTIGNETILVKKRTNVDEKAKYNSTIDGRSPHSYNPIIPEGYTPIDAGDAKWGNGSSAPTQDSVDHGLVIKDDSNNEWVWIPVEESVLSGMYVTSNDGIALSGDVGVTTKMYTKSTTIGRTGDTTTLSRSTPNTTDYANMIASIQKYGGFYIGRYELSNDGVQKGKATLTNTNWYNLYKKCTTLNASDKVESKMIWGIQWDLACDFISKKGEQKNIGNSNLWGNYNNSVGKQKTGYSESWKANNIYDLAGNCLEWTQEAYSIRRVSGSSSGTTSIADNRYRVIRGGFYGSDGSSSPASHRNSYSADISNYGNLRFSSHFNNKVALDPVS